MDDELRAHLEAMEQRITAEFKSQSNYILEFRTEVIKEFKIVEQRLNTLSGLVSGLQTTIPAVSDSVLGTESTVSRLNREMAEIRARIEKLESAAA